MATKPKTFTRVPARLVRDHGAELGPYGLAVYLALAEQADKAGRCHPSVDRLAQQTGMSPRQVHRVIAKLTDAKLITSERRTIPGSRELDSSRYTVLFLGGTDSQAVPTDSQAGQVLPTSHRGTASQAEKEDCLEEDPIEEVLARDAKRILDAFPEGRQDVELATVINCLKNLPEPIPVDALVADIQARAKSHGWNEQGGRWANGVESYFEKKVWKRPIQNGPTSDHRTSRTDHGKHNPTAASGVYSRRRPGS